MTDSAKSTTQRKRYIAHDAYGACRGEAGRSSNTEDVKKRATQGQLTDADNIRYEKLELKLKINKKKYSNRIF